MKKLIVVTIAVAVTFYSYSSHSAGSDVKDWTIELNGAKTFAQYSGFKTKLKAFISDNVQCIEKKMNRSQIIIALQGKTSVTEMRSALNQMTQDGSDVKIEWKMKEVDDAPYFVVDVK